MAVMWYFVWKVEVGVRIIMLPYKRNRSDARAVRTETEVEEDEVFWETFDNSRDFIDQKTNCTVLRHERLEADDLIAGWIQYINDNHGLCPYRW